MLFSELYKIMVNQDTFVGFRGAIAPITLSGSDPGNVLFQDRPVNNRPTTRNRQPEADHIINTPPSYRGVQRSGGARSICLIV